MHSCMSLQHKNPYICLTARILTDEFCMEDFVEYQLLRRSYWLRKCAGRHFYKCDLLCLLFSGRLSGYLNYFQKSFASQYAFGMF